MVVINAIGYIRPVHRIISAVYCVLIAIIFLVPLPSVLSRWRSCGGALGQCLHFYSTHRNPMAMQNNAKHHGNEGFLRLNLDEQTGLEELATYQLTNRVYVAGC